MSGHSIDPVVRDLTWRNHIDIQILRYYPWINEIWEDPDGKVHCQGIFPNVLKMLAQGANFTYEYRFKPDICAGMRLDNGTWLGGGGLLQRKVVDMFFPWAEPRDEGLLSTWPLFITDTKMLASLGLPEAGSFINFLFTFDVEIWYIMFSVVMVTVVVSALSDVFAKERRFRTKPVLKEIDYYFWMFVSAIFCEGSFKVPFSRRSQFLLCIWLLAILTLMNAFSGQFKAQLMKQKEEERIQTPGDLADRPHLIPIISKESTVHLCFQKSPVEDYKRVWKISQGYGAKSLVNMDFLKDISTYQNAKDGSTVVIFEKTSLRGYFHSVCRNLTGYRKMYFSDPNIDLIMLTFGARHGMPDDFLRKFNLWTKRMIEAHIFDRILHDAMWTNDDCEDIPPEPTLKLHNLLPIFYLLLVFNSIAAVVLCMELIVYSLKDKPKCTLPKKTWMD